MYKNILLALLVAFIAGCSKPKPQTVPSWYTNVPQDYKLLYAVGSSSDIDKAKKIAIMSLRDNLNKNVDNKFANTKHILKPIDAVFLKEILEHNSNISKKISLRTAKIEKSKNFKGQEYVLVSIPRIDIFSKLKIISDAKLRRMKEANKRGQNKSPVDRFIALEPIIKAYSELSSLTQYKEFLISTYSGDDEFNFLKDTKNEYEDLHNTINVYVLTDVNSRIFAYSIKKALKEKGFSTKNSISTKNSLKLLITSKTDDSKDYTFNQSKSLVKFTTYNKDKKKISFRQHTFIGKSRKSYKEAKQQSAIHLGYKVKKLGVFDFIGFKNNKFK